jgi:porin
MLRSSRNVPQALAVLVFTASIALAQDAPADSFVPPVQPASEARPSGILPIPDFAGDPLSRKFLLGDWGGARTDLANKGVQFDLSFTQVYQGIVGGGDEQAWRYGGKLVSHTNFDFDRMELIPGGILLVTTESRYGESVNGIAGTLLPVDSVLYFPLTDELDEDLLIAITELRYTQLFSPELGVFFGKYVPLGGDLNEFAGGRGDTQFMSQPFLGPSVTALINPYSTLGAGAFYNPSPNASFTFSMYQSADSSTTSGFQNFNEGWTMDLSARFQYRIGNLPGGVRGAFEYAFDGNYADFTDRFIDPSGSLRVPSSSDAWLVYGNIWQYVYVADESDKPINLGDGRPDRKGIGLFARWGISSDVNPIKWTVSGGIGGRGLIPGREDDSFGVGYAFGEARTDDFVPGSIASGSGSRAEAFYNMAITPATNLTFDVQYADQLLAGQDPAWILGLRLRLNF